MRARAGFCVFRSGITKNSVAIGLGSLAWLVFISGCGGGDDGGSTDAGSGGAAGSGSGGAAGGGGIAGSSGFWPKPHDASCAPAQTPPSSHTTEQADCLDCHKPGIAAPTWLFGGVAYEMDGKTGQAHVEVAVSDGTNVVVACSDSKGLFWAPVSGNPAIDWSSPSAQTRMRNANAEKVMTQKVPNGRCLSCHGVDEPRLGLP